ncbi:helix-turn-helix domain-containing protein [Streptomyces alboflavus]|uniref:helix-turn-helix domain-containing protein n=1 Tax=Streptomyces alboflavus TaxID=67267 RepID=UPI000F657E1E|nr:helix-turn-helix domain-containing protein [Streptomyces alboflavus]
MTDREFQFLAEWPEVLTGAEVSEVLRFDPRRVAALAQAGELPAFRAHQGPSAPWRFERRRIVLLVEGGDPFQGLPPLLADRPAVLTTKEVAEILRFDPPTVAQMAASGVLPGFKVGAGPRGRWRFNKRPLQDRITAAAPTTETPPTA